jgi:hypothetical protein
MPRGSRPGEKRGGRKPGVPNKNTAAVKATVVQAFEELGGVPGFVAWGKKYPTEFYKIYAKLLPTEIKADVAGGLRMELVEEIVEAKT